MILLGALSVILTAVLVIIGLFLLVTGKKTGNGTTQTQDEKLQNETHDFWYYLGFVDDTPNVIRARVAGNEKNGRVVGYMSNLKGKVVDPRTGKINPRPTNGDRYDGDNSTNVFFRNTFGKRWYGIPFIQNVKPLSIDRVVSKDTEATQQTLSDELLPKTVVRYGLYGDLIRPTLHKDVDTKNNVRFSVISYAVMEVTDAQPAFELYPDSLLQTASKIISAFLSRSTVKMEYDAYKEEGNQFAQEKLDELNILLSPLGLKITQMTMSDPELNPAIQTALEAKATAEQKAAARRLEGEGEKDYKKSVADGTAYEIEKIARAKRARFQEYYDFYISADIEKAVAVRMANEMVAAEFNAEAVGKLTGVYAPGGKNRVQLAVPVSTGEKK